jgi:hypothetical protein
MESQFVASNVDNSTEPGNYVGALYGFITKKLRRAREPGK